MCRPDDFPPYDNAAFECSADTDGHCETHNSTWSNYGVQPECDTVTREDKMAALKAEWKEITR